MGEGGAWGFGSGFPHRGPLYRPLVALEDLFLKFSLILRPPRTQRGDGCDESANVVKAYDWFGYELHIFVDSPHEVAVAYKVTSARVGDNEVLGELLEDGKTLRVECELDCRRFPQIPRATKKFERLYRDRGAVERVNARLRLFWGVDDGM